ncbi:hypothetical protein M3690_04145 [Priestia megaterium]|uniref:hypothetical protein n=1 Tax=Priestia megaterium TaxID=1404 RepID=UPI00204044A5|nr:hypothetical protein [Priestia megaterium]MCM3792482.1 hypothetical protein [Priestia megaterium]
MTKLFNCLVEVSVDFTFNVKNAKNMEEAIKVAHENVNDYDTQFDRELTLMSFDGEITFKQVENQIEVHEVYYDGGFKAAGTAHLILSKDIAARSFSQAQYNATTTFNDYCLSIIMGMLKVKNSENETVNLSVGDYNIGDIDVEEIDDKDWLPHKLEEILENFQKKTLVLLHGKEI